MRKPVDLMAKFDAEAITRVMTSLRARIRDAERDIDAQLTQLLDEIPGLPAEPGNKPPVVPIVARLIEVHRRTLERVGELDDRLTELHDRYDKFEAEHLALHAGADPDPTGRSGRPPPPPIITDAVAESE